MIAYYNIALSRYCAGCSRTVCSGGTGCPNYRDGSDMIQIVLESQPRAFEAAAMVKKLREELAHPRYANDAPRSPKPRFRKGNR